MIGPGSFGANYDVLSQDIEDTWRRVIMENQKWLVGVQANVVSTPVVFDGIHPLEVVPLKSGSRLLKLRGHAWARPVGMACDSPTPAFAAC